MWLSNVIAVKDHDALQAHEAACRHSRHLRDTKDRVIWTWKGMGRDIGSGFGEADKQIYPCRKAMIAVRIAAVMAAGAMVISQI